MKVIRLYTGSDQRSHFEEKELSFGGDKIHTTELQAASGVVFRRAPVGHVIDWHPAPRRQYVVTLSGSWEIECSDGTKRIFKPRRTSCSRKIWRQGPRFERVLGNEPHLFMTVPLAEKLKGLRLGSGRWSCPGGLHRQLWSCAECEGAIGRAASVVSGTPPAHCWTREHIF